MPLLVVGSVALDSVKTPSGEVNEVLGGAAVYFSTAASIFTRVNLVGVVGRDFPEEHIEFLRKRNIDTKGLKIEDGETFRWVGSYMDDLNQALTLDTKVNVFADFNPKLPEEYRDCRYIFLANIDPKLQIRVVNQIKNPKVVALDTMNYWISNSREELLEAIAKIDVLIINDAEAREITDERNINKAMEKILNFGIKLVVVKKGEYGVAGLNSKGFFALPAFPLKEVVDPTGAGDTFAGGFMGYLAYEEKETDDNISIRNALAHGVALASFCVEDFSLNRLKKVTKEEILNRVNYLREMVSF